ncbi:hypothetical protein BHE74_00009029, partial [Ensete ventricosum]
IASSAGAPEGTGSALHERPLGSLRLWGFRVSPFRKGFPESSSQWRVPVVEGSMFLRLSFCVSDLEAIVSSPGDGYGSWVFLFRFASDCDRLKVLLEGPWSIFGGRNFAFDSMETTLPPILEEWVQLPTLRFEYNWEHETIFRIASLIDRPLKIDDCSMTFERWRYVRVCVLSDEKLPSVCFRCGCVGHRNCECPKKNPVMEPSKETLRVVARRRNNRPLGMMPPLRLVSPPLRLWIASTGQSSSPGGGQRPRAVAARGSRVLFLPRGEKDRGDVTYVRLIVCSIPSLEKHKKASYRSDDIGARSMGEKNKKAHKHNHSIFFLELRLRLIGSSEGSSRRTLYPTPTLVQDPTIWEEETNTRYISGSLHRDPGAGFPTNPSPTTWRNVDDLEYSDQTKPCCHLGLDIKYVNIFGARKRVDITRTLQQLTNPEEHLEEETHVTHPVLGLGGQASFPPSQDGNAPSHTSSRYYSPGLDQNDIVHHPPHSPSEPSPLVRYADHATTGTITIASTKSLSGTPNIPIDSSSSTFRSPCT